MLRTRASAVAGLSVLALAACSNNPAGPSVPSASEFRLAPGESAAVSGTGFSVRFERVVTDSRCPANALCITAGDAEVAVSVQPADRSRSDYSLRTTARENAVRIGDWILSLTLLEPYPFGPVIQPGEYRATFRVDPLSSTRP